MKQKTKKTLIIITLIFIGICIIGGRYSVNNKYKEFLQPEADSCTRNIQEQGKTDWVINHRKLYPCILKGISIITRTNTEGLSIIDLTLTLITILTATYILLNNIKWTITFWAILLLTTTGYSSTPVDGLALLIGTLIVIRTKNWHNKIILYITSIINKETSISNVLLIKEKTKDYIYLIGTWVIITGIIYALNYKGLGITTPKEYETIPIIILLFIFTITITTVRFTSKTDYIILILTVFIPIVWFGSLSEYKLYMPLLPIYLKYGQKR